MRFLLALAGFAMLWLSPATAQDYPAKPVRIVTVTSAGGTSDIFIRALADEMRKSLGQPIVIENRPGGAFNIGARACAESPPDGYTICILPGEPLVFSQFLYKSLAFDPAAFVPITQLFTIVQALVASKQLNVGTFDELIALSKAKPGTLSYSTFSFPLVYFMEKLKKQTGADMVYVPYRSGNEVVNAIISGSTPIGVLGLSNMLPQLRAGLITGIAVNSNTRSPLFPDLPTLTEASGEDLPPAWFGMFAPRATPKPIIARIHSEVVRITSDPEFRQKNFVERAIDYAVNTPEKFAQFIVSDRKGAERIFKESGEKPQ